MSRRDHERASENVRVDPPIIFDMRREEIAVPLGTEVELFTSAGIFPMTLSGDGQYSFSGELPAQSITYRFHIVPPQRSTMPSFIYPPGNQPAYTWEPPTGDGDDLGIAPTEVFRPDEVAETTGDEVTRVMEARRAPRPRRSAVEAVEAEDAGVDVIRTTTRHLALRSFEGLGALGATAKEKKQKGKEVFRVVTAFADELVEAAESRDPEVRGFLRADLGGRIDAAHGEWIERHEALEPPEKEVLKTPAGRARFRLRGFHELCAKGAFKLGTQDRYRGALDERLIDEHIRARLGNHYGLFCQMFDPFDGGSVRRALDRVAFEVIENTPPSAFDASRRRTKERAKLAERVGRAASESLEPTFSATKESSGVWGFLKEHGGRTAFRLTALSMAATNPILALGLWSAPAISEAFGAQFGASLGSIAKAPFRGLRRGTGWLLNRLPDAVRDRMPDDTVNWLNRPTPPSFEHVGRASMTPGERGQAFLKGMVPLPQLIFPATRFAGKKVGAWRARRRGIEASEAATTVGRPVTSGAHFEDIDVGAKFSDERGKALASMQEALDAALGSLRAPAPRRGRRRAAGGEETSSAETSA